MFYIVQENTFREKHYDNLIKALDRYDLDYTIVRSFPYTDNVVEVFNIPDEPYVADKLPGIEVPIGSKVFIFGSVKLARVCVEKNLTPGSLLNDKHDFLHYKDHYKDNLLNYDSEIHRIGDDIKWKGYKFLRPTTDNKAFTGQEFTQVEWEDKKEYILHNFRSKTLNEDTLIQVSNPKYIQKEIRFWVVGGKVVTGSQYRLGNSVVLDDNFEPEAKEFAQRMVDIHQIASSFVIDVCLSDDGWKIVECGCINSAGFYKSNLSLLVQKLEEYYGDQQQL